MLSHMVDEEWQGNPPPRTMLISACTNFPRPWRAFIQYLSLFVFQRLNCESMRSV